jgi:hypothetical protein
MGFARRSQDAGCWLETNSSHLLPGSGAKFESKGARNYKYRCDINPVFGAACDDVQY